MLAGFLRVGDGDCTAEAGRQVRGLSRRDLSHDVCRLKCENATCLGYTYAPCERICTVYGNPTNILYEGPEGWRPLNGWGAIKSSSGRCGSACFLRKDPCPEYRIVSNGAYVPYPDFRFATNIQATCPTPFVGTLTLRCALGGVEILDGRCSKNCSGGESQIGSFNVPYTGMFHGAVQTTQCSESRAGALGSVSVTCNDGTVELVNGTCGFACQQGSVRAGSGIVEYPAMDHLVTRTLVCPTGYDGSVGVICNNGYVYVTSGRCNAHCEAGTVNITVGPINGTLLHGSIPHTSYATSLCKPSENLTGTVRVDCVDGEATMDESEGAAACYRQCHAGTVLDGIKAVAHPWMSNGTTANLACNEGFVGGLFVQCFNGTVSVLTGDCNQHCNGTARHVNEFLQAECEAGRGLCVNATVTSNGVTLPYGYMTHTESKELQCPNTSHTGVLNVTCLDGMVGYGGMCGRNCPGGMLSSRGTSMIYQPLKHGEEREVPCPLPWGESMYVRCYDSSTRVTGACGAPCLPGLYTKNGAQISYQFMNHSERRRYPCQPQFAVLSFSGSIEFECVDGLISSSGRCYPDCAEGTLENNGAEIFHADIKSEHNVTTRCEPGEEYGIVVVGCVQGLPKVIEGNCGAPCEAQTYMAPRVGDRPIVLEEIGHTAQRWYDCNPELSGRVHFKCDSGFLRIIEGSCGHRCPAQVQDVHGAMFTTSRMEHMEELNVSCTPPYTGVVDVKCAYGQLNVTSRCVRGCFAGYLNVNGAYVQYPQMLSGGRYQTGCPTGFAGEVLMECLDEVPYALVGTCYSHCQAGRWMAPEDEGSYPIEHNLIMFNQSQDIDCPTGWDGYVILRCENGALVKTFGGCYGSCMNGRMITRPGVQFRYAGLSHGEMTSSMQCPDGFVGSVRLYCNNSVVSIGMGGCPAHCTASGIDGATYGGMLHEEIADLVCPEFGALNVRCYDGEVNIISGACIYGCAAGAILDERNSSIEFIAMEHDGNATGVCSGDSTGFIRVKCNDTHVYADPLPGEKCFRHCLPKTVTTLDGSQVQTPYIYHGQMASIDCPAGKPGIIMVQCYDDNITFVEGWCGDMNCAGGEVLNGGAVVPYGTLNNGRTSVVPVSCNDGPSKGYLGEINFACSAGDTSILNITHFLPVLPEESPGVVNVTTLTAQEKESHDDEFFLLCQCCVPPDDPPAVADGLAVDFRVILYWAIGTAILGLIIATATGAIFMRGKAKISRIVPEPSPNKIADLKMLDAGPVPGGSQGPNPQPSSRGGHGRGSGRLAIQAAPTSPTMRTLPGPDSPSRMKALEGDPRRSLRTAAQTRAVRQQMAIEWRGDGLPPGSQDYRRKEFEEKRKKGVTPAAITYVGTLHGTVPPRS